MLSILKSIWFTTRWSLLSMLCGSMIIQLLLPQNWRWNNELFHVLVEGGGALIGFGLALIIAGMILKKRLEMTHAWLIACFLSMGTLDMSHSIMHPGQAFVWLHSMATFSGGLFASLVWLPKSFTRKIFNVPCVTFIFIFSILFSIASIYLPDMTLAMLNQKMQFTWSAKFLNIFGGMGFLAAWLYFAREYHRQQKPELLFFANHFCLFALAGLLFESSALWDGDWWLWHILRAFAYIFLLMHFGEMYWKDMKELSKLNQDLEERVFARTAELAAIIKGSPTAIITADNHSTIETFSPAAEKIFGWSAKKIIGKKLNCLMDSTDKETHDEHIHRFLKTNKPSKWAESGREMVGVKKDGTHFPISLAVNQVKLPDKTLFVGLVNDISDRKLAQKKLLQSERLASLGQMVAGVAHEINSPLGTAVTNISELEEKTIQFKGKLAHGISKSDLNHYTDDIQDYSLMAKENLLHAAKLVRSFKMVAIDQTYQDKISFNLKQHIKAGLNTLSHELKNLDINIDLDCPHQLVISSHPGAFTQIISNLVLNSKIHGFDNGKLSGEIKIHIKSHSKPHQIVLTYRDNGTGMNDDQRKRIFDPFFTTRRYQGGSGLGMHIVHNLVTDTLKGTITLESNTNSGVSFVLSLPIFSSETDEY